VENLCPRVIWIDKGMVREDGRSTEVIEKYLSQGEDLLVQSSLYDFRDRLDHDGSGEIKYTGFEILDKDAQPKNIIRSGDFIKFRLHYEAHQITLNPRFQLSLNTEKGARIATFGSDISGHYVDKLPPGEGYIDVDIDSINIMPDRYFFNFWIFGDRKKSYYERLLWCARMDVEYSNYYKTGKGIDKELGHVFMPCKWDMNGIAQDFTDTF
jgi:lipopolysaccharide transport system ATP-binding protein